jgi:5'-deoxynucleotidase YfbR-like HD superfamily hydrolase
MRLSLPNENLKVFGFLDIDIENIRTILLDNHIQSLVEVDETADQSFDLGEFVKLVISSKEFRFAVLDVCNTKIDGFPECLLNNFSLGPNSYSFKFNLFLLLVDSLNKNKEVLPLYNQFLELDRSNHRTHNTLLDAFFEMCRIKMYHKIDVVNLFANSNTLERSGWTGTNVPTPHKESIAEHMYFMYTLANIYLPNQYFEDGYDKNKILNMIMIHDLAETLTGDIPHPEKTEDDEIKEDLTAQALWCSLLYNQVSSANDIYEAWNDWSLNLTFNAKVAHDFDAIQLNYQFFTYACKYPETYSDDNILRWTRRQPKTEIGKEIYKELILNNPKFKDRVGVIYGKY